MKKVLVLLALPFLAISGFAQNSAHFKAQALMRDKKDYKAAIEVCKAALDNPKTTKKAEIARDMGLAYASLFNNELGLASRSVPFDTLAFCSYLDNAVEAFTQSNQFDHEPNKKGKVDPIFHTLNHLNLKQMLDYYNYAAIFQVQNGHNDKSLVYFEKYLNFPKNPVFSQSETDSIYKTHHESYENAAVNMMRIAYGMKDWDKVLRYSQLYTPKDSVGLHDFQIMKMDAYLMKKDTVGYVNALKDAVATTGNSNLIGQLITYYMRKQNRPEAVAMADELIAKNPQGSTPYYIKGVIEMNIPPYDYVKARESFQKALDVNPNYIEAIKNLGVCWVNDIVDQKMAGKIVLPKGTDNASKAKFNKIKTEKIDPYYKKALPYFEKLRTLEPDQPQLWAEGLYNVYQNLQMFNKANEIKPYLNLQK